MTDTLWQWIAIWYLFASLICFAIYAFDKSAAINRRRRVSEASLITWGLLGGWPGAIIAQQLFRHKTQKTMFLIVFFLSVTANLAALFAATFLY